MSKTKYTVLDVLDELWDVSCSLEQVMAIIEAMRDLFFEDDNVVKELSNNIVLCQFDNARLLLGAANELIYQSHEKLDDLQDKTTMNLNTEVAEVSV